MSERRANGSAAVVISASIAFDHIMSFGGSIADHIIAEKAHVISVSFLVDELKRLRGGVGGNIAYSLGLLGAPSTLVGAVGHDFGAYKQLLSSMGVDCSYVIEAEHSLTASAFMMADQASNQIASFFPGPSAQSAEFDVTELGNRADFALVGATDPEAMRRHAAQFGSSSARLIYDPAFQIIILSGDDLRAGIDQAYAVIGNDYEFAMMERKTGLSIDAIAERVPLTVVTYGADGSELRRGSLSVRIPAAPAHRLVEPTGAGDAYRAGLIKGLLLDRELEVVGRVAGLAAVHAVEHHGPQEHEYTPEQFVSRFDAAYPDFAGSVSVADFSREPSHAGEWSSSRTGVA
jgi:adenosine kinase